ncbi:MAG: hypothetical protein VX709_00945 [Pseudomonadota bacterium]|nr:hypothetical protein [Pseudomonadota bacterium]
MMEASSVLEESLCIEDKDSLENHFDAPMGIAEAVIFESLDKYHSRLDRSP